MTSLMVMTTAAVLGGSVCGDHISPISDTTILSSTGADCNHINHVESQMQYGLLVAAVSFICYVVGGLMSNQLVAFALGVVALLAVVVVVREINGKRETV